LIAMQSDYTAAITAMALIALALTAMTVFVLSRPSDLKTSNPL